MVRFSAEINDVNFNIEFRDKVNILRGSSGTGKSFMFAVIMSYCTEHNISCVKIDYNLLSTCTNTTDFIYQCCSNKEVILLDNADLYLDADLFDKLVNLDATLVISKKTVYGLRLNDAHFYKVHYNDSSLVTERL